MGKVDWVGVGATLGVAVLAVIVVRTVESVFPSTQKLTRLPEAALKKVFG